MTIYGFPTQGSSYTQSLYDAVRQRGVEVGDGIWAGRWLLSHLRCGDTLHLHWPSFQYYDPKSTTRSLWSLLRFVVLFSILHLRGVSIVWTAHNLYPHDGGRDVWMHRFARWFVVRIADRIFAHGPTAVSIVQQEFNVCSNKLRVIRHGHWIGAYPNETTRVDARQSLGLSATAHVFLFIGLCKPYKGLEALIEAMASLPSGALLVIAGHFQSREYQAAITSLVERTGRALVSIHPGFIEDEKLQLFLNAADTVVLPYREILTSGTAMLAMSYGRPVVAPRMGSLVDIVDETCGVLYDVNDSAALGQAMQQARNKNFNSDEIRTYVSTFTWDDTAQALIDEHHMNDPSSRRSYLKITHIALAGNMLLLALLFITLPSELPAPFARVALTVLLLALLLCGLVFVSGRVVLTRDARERKHLPDLFYRHISRVPVRWTNGWRRWIRPLLGPALRPGDVVRLRDAAEILATLDESGKLDGMPFMPEMLGYQGREMLVHRRIDKINDWIGGNELRRTINLVTLVDSRCNGAAHGGCQAECQLLWKEPWLRRVAKPQQMLSTVQDAKINSNANGSAPELRDLDQLLISATSRQVPKSDGTTQQYMCQITELLRASTPMSPRDLRMDLRPLLSGNVPLTGWLIAKFTALFNKLQELRGGVEYPVTAPQLEHGPTPVTHLNLRSGELVRVRSKYEICRTLYKNHNRGIWFGKELVRFCNHSYTVRSRIERIINERSGEMMNLSTPSIILESVCGSGEFLRFCPQNEYVFWREIWLERVKSR